MRLLPRFLLLALIMILAACDASDDDVDDTPSPPGPTVPNTPPPSTDQNVMRWSIASADFISADIAEPAATLTPSQAGAILAVSGSGFVDGVILNGGALAFVVVGVDRTGTYTASQQDDGNFGAIALFDAATQTDARYEATTLTLALTALTDEGVAGTFEMRVVNEDDASDVLNLTNGQFAIAYE